MFVLICTHWHLRLFALMTPKNYWAQISTNIWARLRPFCTLSATERKFAVMILRCARSTALVCAHICTKSNIWTVRKIICTQLRLVQLSVTETIFARLSANERNWVHSDLLHILRLVRLSANKRIWAQISTIFHVKICAQSATLAQTSAIESKCLRSFALSNFERNWAQICTLKLSAIWAQIYVYERNRAQLSTNFALSFVLCCSEHLPMNNLTDSRVSIRARLGRVEINEAK